MSFTLKLPKSILRNNIFLCLKTPRLWYFVSASLGKWLLPKIPPDYIVIVILALKIQFQNHQIHTTSSYWVPWDLEVSEKLRLSFSITMNIFLSQCSQTHSIRPIQPFILLSKSAQNENLLLAWWDIITLFSSMVLWARILPVI